MLVRLVLEQFVLVDRGELEFGPGLNVLTGETGAGKSILIDALGLLVGGRGSADWVRKGSGGLRLEGVFDLHDNPEILGRLREADIPVDEEELFIVRREIGADGRSRSFANGRQVLVSQLREWTEGLVWIVGQGEQRALLTSQQQELLLDRLAGGGSHAQQYRQLRRHYLDSKQRARDLDKAREAFRAEEEWLEFQVRELESASVEPGERQELIERRDALVRASRDTERRQDLLARLQEDDGSVLDHIETLLHRLGSDPGDARARDARSRDPRVGDPGTDDPAVGDPESYDPWSVTRAALLSARTSVHEAIDAIPDAPEDSEAELERIEERISEIARLLRKHGGDEESLRAHLDRMRERLEQGRCLDDEIDRAEREIQDVQIELSRVAEELSELRRGAAGRLSAKLTPELEALAMPGAALAFEFDRQESPDGLGSGDGPRYLPLEGGLDRITVRFQSHGGLEWGDLGRVASGGELSRVLLAMQAVLGEGAPPATWVFDEIDQGIGGETARRVGERLARMAEHTQVLLVTHLPAIAALAQRHLTVTKEGSDAVPSARIHPVEGEERLAELARMLSGDVGSKIARKHAEELLGAASVVAKRTRASAPKKRTPSTRSGSSRRQKEPR
ncbi:MAG: DNA repair protein RecN [Candidatus Eisenbacteria bacterium]|nr:DNA repair protein RecN [Candidatus Eisenbacteria bacterium]